MEAETRLQESLPATATAPPPTPHPPLFTVESSRLTLTNTWGGVNTITTRPS